MRFCDATLLLFFTAVLLHLSQAFPIPKRDLVLDDPLERIEVIGQRYLKTMQNVKDRSLFIKDLQAFFLDEYEVTGEKDEYDREDGIIKVTFNTVHESGESDAYHPSIDEGHVLIEQLEEMVKGMVGGSRTEAGELKRSQARNYWRLTVRKRENLLKNAPFGSKEYRPQVSKLIGDVREALDGVYRTTARQSATRAVKSAARRAEKLMQSGFQEINHE
jgi:hypothetical protein